MLQLDEQISTEHLLLQERVCRSCGKEKSLLADFHRCGKNATLPSSYSYECKECVVKRTTAYNKKKHKIFSGKGVLNNKISEHIMLYLRSKGVETHFKKRLNDREQLIKKCEIIPIEFVVRNIATGSLTKRLGIEDGTVLDEPLIEYCLKDDKLGDPLISKEHMFAFKWSNNCLLYTSPSPRDS